MKQQIVLSPDAGNGSSSSEPVKRLASRYGIPEKDVEALLYGKGAPKSEALGSDIKGKSMADEFRPGYTIQPAREGGWSPLNVLSLVVGILGILALSIILIAVLKRPRFEPMSWKMPPPPMSAPAKPQPLTSDTNSASKTVNPAEKQDEVPPPAQTNEIAAKPAAPIRHHSTSHASQGFTTTNSIEAQEHLAELRADGNSRAKIHSKMKNGMTVYSVK